jgi:hypothetical protein
MRERRREPFNSRSPAGWLGRIADVFYQETNHHDRPKWKQQIKRMGLSQTTYEYKEQDTPKENPYGSLAKTADLSVNAAI